MKQLSIHNTAVSRAEDLDKRQAKIEFTISVVVLTYNSARTIGACLDSLVGQTNKNFGLIIVDDDSTDRTLAIVDSYKSGFKNKFEVFKNGARNISRGRNIGLASSRSDLAAFLDSDDYAKSDWIESILNSFGCNPGIALLSGKLSIVSTSLFGKAVAANDLAIMNLFNKKMSMFCTSNSVFNKKILKDDYSFDEDFTYAEDQEIAFRIAKKYKRFFDPRVQIYQTCRETAKGYAKQMYCYGMWKIYYSFFADNYRFIDFVPLLIAVSGIVASVILASWFLLFSLVVFSLLEFVFVALTARVEPAVLSLSFPAFLIKNFSWSAGVAIGLMNLSISKKLRTRFIQKRSRLQL